MLWLIFIVSSTLGGWTLLQIIRNELFQFLVNVCLSWTIGSLLSSLAIFILNFILPLNAFLVLVVLSLQVAFIYYGQKYLRAKFQQDYFKHFTIRFENSPSYYLALLIIAIISTLHLLKSYSSFPNYIPNEAREIVDSEASFIASVRFGINRRRKNVLLYKDPLNFNQYFTEPTLPLLFTAALCALGSGYAESSIMIAFLNIMTTAVLIYFYSMYFSRHHFASTICFMFNGGWAFFRVFFGDDCANNDYLRNICKRAPVPWFSTLGVFLSYSKSASFSIPLAIISILLTQFTRKQNTVLSHYIIAGLCATLIPSVGVSTACFVISSCFSASAKYFIPFAVTLAPKFLLMKVRNFPIWREYQMAGIMSAPIVTWFDQFGPMFFAFLIPFRSFDDQFSLHRHLTFLSSFLLFNFFRIGNSYFENVLAITATILPIVCIYFVDDLFILAGIFKDKLNSGVISTLCFLTYTTFILGGILSLFVLTRNKSVGIDDIGIECGNWIKKNVNGLVLSEAVSFNPATIVGGKQIVCGDLKALWRRGSNVTAALRLVREVERDNNPFPIMERIGARFFLTKSDAKIAKAAKDLKTQLDVAYSDKKWILFKML